MSFFRRIKYSIRPIYWFICGHHYVRDLKNELRGYKNVLDLGCGKDSPLKYCRDIFSVGVDDFDPYLEEAKINKTHKKYIKSEIKNLDLPPKSFDVVIALELIEHMQKEDGLILIKKMENWASKKIIISTPNGMVENNPYDGNEKQKHLSGWSVDDLKAQGFQKILGASGFKGFKGDSAEIKYHPKIIWRLVSDLSQRFIYKNPKKAFDLFAIKNL